MLLTGENRRIKDDKGSAEFYYDTESGEVISGEEWIEDFYDKVSAYSMDEY